MGVHNALNRGPLGKAVKGSLGDQDSESALERWGETLTPVMDIWSMPEWAFMRSERLCAGQFDVTGGAATLAEVLLYNPAGSKQLVTVMHSHVAVTTATVAIRYALQRGTPLGMLVPIGFTRIGAGPIDTRDPRLIGVGGTNAILATATNAAVAGQTFDTQNVVLNTTADMVDPVILAPDTGLVIGFFGVGIARMVGGIYWRERLAFQSELGF